ncbi:MotA/TolQ/ExbB proton channel family protein [Desulfocicer niacini]
MESYIRSGGEVMYPILLVSFIMWMLIINRVYVMRKLFIKNIPRIEAGQLIQKNQMPHKKYQGANSLLVREFLSQRTGDRDLDGFILDETVLRLTSEMDRHLALIGVLSGVAPLLGLLGTVVGMMATFDVITVFGTGNAKAMAGGISVALITTQTGLLVSIPGLYMSGFLKRRANNLKHRISATGMYLRRFL